MLHHCINYVELTKTIEVPTEPSLRCKAKCNIKPDKDCMPELGALPESLDKQVLRLMFLVVIEIISGPTFNMTSV